MRLSDRFYDLYVHEKMQKIVGDRIRPEGKKDPDGVERARNELEIALSLVDRDMAEGGWATGLTFTMADCAAAPALYYANQVAPFGDNHPGAARYLERLMARPSFARVLAEAEPYFAMFPNPEGHHGHDTDQARHLHDRANIQGGAKAGLCGMVDAEAKAKWFCRYGG